MIKKFFLLCLFSCPLFGLHFSYKVKHLTAFSSDELTNKVNSFLKENFHNGKKIKLIDIKYGESSGKNWVTGYWYQSYSVLIQYEEWK